MKYLLVTTLLLKSLSSNAFAQHAHEMQHGFIISEDEAYFSHLVATGHHSHQLSLSGKLKIHDPSEREVFTEKQKENVSKKSYFLFQAQKLNLPHTHQGQVLHGHIIESPVGDYWPKNVVVKDAEIEVKKVHINTINPFFLEN